MVRKISIHQENIFTSAQGKSIHVGRTEAQLSSTLQNLNFVLAEHSLAVSTMNQLYPAYLQFQCDLIRAIRTAVLNNHDLVRITAICYLICE